MNKCGEKNTRRAAYTERLGAQRKDTFLLHKPGEKVYARGNQSQDHILTRKTSTNNKEELKVETGGYKSFHKALAITTILDGAK